jgi:putative hydrolase of the HAD superfamily
MPAIRTILWDMGGVLLTNGWDHTERDAVLEHFGLERGEFEERHPAANDAWEKGEINAEEYLRRTVFYKPRNFSWQDFLQAMKLQSQMLHPGCFRILRGLAASHEYKLGVLNNEATELNDYRIEKFGLRELFEYFLSSCYLGLRKPDERIFVRALQIIQADPAATVFIDDREGNVNAAKAAGMQAIHFTAPEVLIEQMGALGIHWKQ